MSEPLAILTETDKEKSRSFLTIGTEDKMNVVKAAKMTHLITSALLLILGVIVLIFHPSEFLLRILMGSCFLLIGGTKLLGFFSNDLYKLAFQFDLALGFLTLIVGCVLLIRQGILLQTTASIAGLFVVVDSLFKIQTAFDAKKFGMKKWVTILVAAIVVGTVGTMTLFDPFGMFNPSSLMILIAVAFMLNGALNIWTTAYTVRVKAKKKNLEEKYEDYL